MDQKIYYSELNEKKRAYELSPAEFSKLLQNLRLFGDLAKVAIIASNDKKSGKRPRIQPTKDAVEILHEVLGEENAEDADIKLNELDVLRVERSEVNWAVSHASKSELFKERGNVVLGLATMACAFDELRGPILDKSPLLVDGTLIETMFNQFHSEGAKRISLTV